MANPLDFSGGMQPTLLFCNIDSLAERIQRAFPGARVVQTLNIVTAAVMVDPGSLPEETTVSVSGDDQTAEGRVRQKQNGAGRPARSNARSGRRAGRVCRDDPRRLR